MRRITREELFQTLGLCEDGSLFHDKKGRPVATPVPLAPLADSHGHLTCFKGLDASVALCRAALAGVRLMVVPIDPTEDLNHRWQSVPALMSWLEQERERARELLDACAEEELVPPDFGEDIPSLPDGVRLVAGVHPYGAHLLSPEVMGRLDSLLDHPLCVGVGEIGLDFGPYSELPSDVQERAFRQQLRIAHERGLPVELHIRDGQDNTAGHDLAARVLQEEGVPGRGCDLHCFTQGPEVMVPFVELGCHIAFGGAATFGRSDDIRGALAQCPQDLLLLETDCPYMAPVPLRGRQCEPAMVSHTASLLADHLWRETQRPLERSYATFWENARRLFSL